MCLINLIKHNYSLFPFACISINLAFPHPLLQLLKCLLKQGKALANSLPKIQLHDGLFLLCSSL